ncbi:PREDICTED: non-specific lipid-transfer protein 9-like [Camelina sativa]|uniref:Non-specific lipid-transfer protein n=1 Tax=Camelina sativa TaxID=90675 RepID=A0ABM0W8N3_CAMSA|nr:PREDICTED: non-specific lipid-transfer protein 9-like [Camelina sativa]
MSKSVLIACVIAITIFTLPFNIQTVNSLTPCEVALNDVKPCLTYLWAPPQAKPSPDCCRGVSKVNNSVKTFDQRRDMCICLSTVAAMTTADPYKFDHLPKLCGITLFAPIGPKLDCNSIKV